MLRIAAIVLFANVFSFAGPTTQPSYEDYTVLSERNMFLRDRPRPLVRERRPQATQPAERYDTPEAIERNTVLRGVVIEEGELHAYVENTHTGAGQRLATGDAIGGGHVTDIAIDAVCFENNGRLTWVEVGQNLQGTRVAAPASAPSTTMPTDTANMSVLERMKMRRMQEHAH